MSLADEEMTRKHSCSLRVLECYDNSRKLQISESICWSHFGETEVSRDALAFEATFYWCLLWPLDSGSLKVMKATGKNTSARLGHAPEQWYWVAHVMISGRVVCAYFGYVLNKTGVARGWAELAALDRPNSGQSIAFDLLSYTNHLLYSYTSILHFS